MADEMDHEAAMRAGVLAERLHSEARDRAGAVSLALTRMARTFEWSAALAEAHAERNERAGLGEEAARERAIAARASDAAQRARARAEDLARVR